MLVDPFVSNLQKTVYYDRYARWNPQTNRRETWKETTDRVIHFLRNSMYKHIDAHKLSPPDLDFSHLTQAMLRLDVLPSMRVVQMAGPALERCNVGAYNCAYLPLQDWQAFGELLYILMQGTGVGFSVEQQYVSRLEVIKTQCTNDWKVPYSPHVIADTTEGWCDALVLGLKVWASGADIEFDYSNIRPFGTPLKTKGGTSSGPEPLRQLLEFARTMLLRHQGRQLSTINAHDLACFCGSIVQVGGVRRAAEISLSDLDDRAMRGAKQGQFWLNAPERAMANNSAVYDEKPTLRDFMDEWRELMDSGTGERGIFNREGLVASLPARRDTHRALGTNGKFGTTLIQFGVNPCGEIILRPFEFCNLSIAVARPDDTVASLAYKVKLATQFGIVQSLLTDFKYLRPDWQRNCQDERLLGVDITGQMDCRQLVDDDGGLYSFLRKVAVDESSRLADELHINRPAAVTCVKPSGNSSQLLGVSSGLHPRYAQYYIRRVRIGASSPVSQLLKAQGVPCHPEVGQNPDNPTVWVFEFPVASPEAAVVRDQMDAISQLEHWKIVKQHWTEHNPSITVYVKDDEWLEVGAWVYKHWNIVGGISFLPWDGGVYNLAPYEAITKEQYEQLVSKQPELDFGQLPQYEHSDHTTVNNDYACVGGVCEL